MNYLRNNYSILTARNVQSVCAGEAPKEMSTQVVFVQQFARLFQHYREALSPEAEQECATLNAVPTEERRRLVAAARLAILELETNGRMEDDSRRYFAKPGEAEWGC